MNGNSFNFSNWHVYETLPGGGVNLNNSLSDDICGLACPPIPFKVVDSNSLVVIVGFSEELNWVEEVVDNSDVKMG